MLEPVRFFFKFIFGGKVFFHACFKKHTVSTRYIAGLSLTEDKLDVTTRSGPLCTNAIEGERDIDSFPSGLISLHL